MHLFPLTKKRIDAPSLIIGDKLPLLIVVSPCNEYVSFEFDAFTGINSAGRSDFTGQNDHHIKFTLIPIKKKSFTFSGNISDSSIF